MKINQLKLSVREKECKRPGQTNITNSAEEKWALLDKDIEIEDTLRSVQLKIGDILILLVCTTSVYSAGVPYAARFTAPVKIPLPLATFQY